MTSYHGRHSPEVVGMAPVIRAATRDASWYNYPGRAGRYHVLLETDENGNLGAFVADVSSGCGISLTVADYASLDAREIPDHLRCKRPGCKARWPR